MIESLKRDGISATVAAILNFPFKRYIKNLSRRTIEAHLSDSIIRNEFREIGSVPSFGRREDLWADAFRRFSSAEICVLEFGVYEGYSIKSFAELNDCKRSRFFGFDSFEGLPEDWRPDFGKGTFDVGGQTPNNDDARISFVKGWFQNTIPNFLENFNPPPTLLVHFDADIYSATLYVMLQLDTRKRPYLAIFDEFPGDEARALFNYIQISGADIKFISKTSGPEGYPRQVYCEIIPKKVYGS
jgi:hypothetical protein